MPQYRKKPVVIEAMQFDGSRTSIDAICRWAKPIPAPGDPAEEPWVDYTYQGGGDVLDPMCHTLEGPLRISVGDWIIKGVAGELYPCKPDIFEATYEPAQQGGQ